PPPRLHLFPYATLFRSNPSLRKAMTMRYAIALYMSSVLGSGVLVLHGLAAQIAGPASLVAWIALSLISYPLAYTFASLSARRPRSEEHTSELQSRGHLV